MNFDPRTFVVIPVLAAALTAQGARPQITLERIMADPEWFARSPEGQYWADDGLSFYWRRKQLGSEARDLFQTDLAGETLRQVADAELPFADVAGGEHAADRSRKVYARNDDIFIKHLTGERAGEIVQLTRTAESESTPFFMLGDARVAFRRNGAWRVRDLATGLEYQPADVRGGAVGRSG